MNLIKVLIHDGGSPEHCDIDVYELPPKDPPVSIIIPYLCSEPYNPIYVCSNDEVIVVFGGESIGEARITGAKVATNDWIIQTDADAVYPPDYIPKIKDYITKTDYPILCTVRRGGFGTLFFKVHESALVVRKDVFLERTKNYPQGVRLAGRRTDVADLFRDAKQIPVEYYHGFTKGEKLAIVISAFVGVPTILYILKRLKYKSKVKY